jgi:acetyl esterase/lipase
MRVTGTLLVVLATRCLAQPAPPQPAYPDWAKVEANIPYDRFKDTVLDIAQPASAAKGKRPGAIILHGGGWIRGRKEAMIRTMCVPFLEKGFVVANVEYRVASAAIAPAAVSDALRAAQWFLNNAGRYNVDRRRVVVMGDSAGGHLTLMTAMTPKSARLGPQARVAAAVNCYGITDVGELLLPPYSKGWAIEWLPENTPNRLEIARRVSPMTYVRKGVPPILTLHGDADTTVPYEQSARLTRALRDAGADARLFTVPKGPHAFMNQPPPGVWDEIWGFLRSLGILR